MAEGDAERTAWNDYRDLTMPARPRSKVARFRRAVGKVLSLSCPIPCTFPPSFALPPSFVGDCHDVSSSILLGSTSCSLRGAAARGLGVGWGWS